MGAENTRFSVKVYIDFMFIEGASVLRKVDDGMHFSAAQFVELLKPKSVCEIKPTL